MNAYYVYGKFCSVKYRNKVIGVFKHRDSFEDEYEYSFS